jgi:hypothetical protein
MGGEQQPETKVGPHDVGLERLRKCIERVLLSSEVRYAVRFDNDVGEGEFAYSWSAIWSEN